MSEADKLFEELGYKKIEDKYNIDFNKIYQFTNGDKVREQIRFCKLDRYIHIENYNFNTGITFGKFLGMQELQAINKKVKELRLDMILMLVILNYINDCKKIGKEKLAVSLSGRLFSYFLCVPLPIFAGLILIEVL